MDCAVLDLETTDLHAVGGGFILCAVVKPLRGKPIVFRNLSCHFTIDGKRQPEQKDREFKVAWRYSANAFGCDRLPPDLRPAGATLHVKNI